VSTGYDAINAGDWLAMFSAWHAPDRPPASHRENLTRLDQYGYLISNTKKSSSISAGVATDRTTKSNREIVNRRQCSISLDCMQENAVRRLLDLRHSSQMWIIDEALAKMNAELSIDLPKSSSRGKAA
jgi:hypothetical protein